MADIQRTDEPNIGEAPGHIWRRHSKGWDCRLWVTDDELIRRLGVPEKIARVNLRMLDAKPGDFPRKQKLWGDLRYWPAVVRYFDQHYGFKQRSASN